MIKAVNILTDSKGNTIGATFDKDGEIVKYKTEQLIQAKGKIKLVNAIIDSNGFIRAKKGNLPKVIINKNPTVIENKEMLQAKELLKNPVMTLYHGNKDPNMVPTFGEGKIHNDYGQGLYTTPDPELGKEWAWGTYTKGDKGYLHGYEIDTTGLQILNLTELDSLHWVAELYANRTLNLDGKEALIDTRDAFIEKYKIDTSKCDIIIGYRADDSYFLYAADFLESAIYRDTLDNALRYGNLGLQVFIKSKRAFERLKKVSFDEVPKLYADRYKKRDKKAADEYSRIKKNQVSRKKETIHKFI